MSKYLVSRIVQIIISQALKKQIDKISKDLKVYVEFYNADKDTVRPLIELLKQNDLQYGHQKTVINIKVIFGKKPYSVGW